MARYKGTSSKALRSCIIFIEKQQLKNKKWQDHNLNQED